MGLKPVNCGCGGEAFVSINGFIEYHVVCASCGLRTDWFRSKDKAIQAWNRAMGITHERAVEYLQSTGWMQDHDYQMMEMGKEMATENFNE